LFKYISWVAAHSAYGFSSSKSIFWVFEIFVGSLNASSAYIAASEFECEDIIVLLFYSSNINNIFSNFLMYFLILIFLILENEQVQKYFQNIFKYILNK